MGNLIEAFNSGQAGANKGLSMGEGLGAVDKAVNGIQRGRIYTWAAAPKGGKSTIVDVGFVIEPWLDSIENNNRIREELPKLQYQLHHCEGHEVQELEEKIQDLQAQIVDLDIIYHSYEIDRVSKEFDFLAHFLYRDYHNDSVELPEGRTFNGKNTVPVSSDYLMGMCKDDEGNLITVTPELYEAIKETYDKRIVPLFGEYDSFGNQIKKGVMTILEYKENPTGIRNWLLNYAKARGTFQTSTHVDSEGKTHTRYLSYTPQNPNAFVIVVTDHLRKLVPERGFQMKQNVDKFSEYAVELRNACKYTFVHIIHLNRAMADIQRLKHLGDRIYPTSEDIKETGNLSEDSNFVFTIFNPNDDKYDLTKHFGVAIKDTKGRLKFPNMRTVHLVESRHCFFPQHFLINLRGDIKHIEKLIIP